MEWLCFGNTSNKRLPIVRVKILRRAANDLSLEHSKNFVCLQSSGGSGVRSVLGVKIGCVFPSQIIYVCCKGEIGWASLAEFEKCLETGNKPNIFFFGLI